MSLRDRPQLDVLARAESVRFLQDRKAGAEGRRPCAGGRECGFPGIRGLPAPAVIAEGRPPTGL